MKPITRTRTVRNFLAATLLTGGALLAGGCAEYPDRPPPPRYVDACLDWWPYVYYAPYDCWAYGPYGYLGWYGPAFVYYPWPYYVNYYYVRRPVYVGPPHPPPAHIWPRGREVVPAPPRAPVPRPRWPR